MAGDEEGEGVNDSPWIMREKARRSFLRWQLRMLDEGGFTEDNYFCVKCQCRHSRTAKIRDRHRKFGITSAEWLEGVMPSEA